MSTQKAPVVQTSAPIMSLHHIHQYFGGVQALIDVDMDIYQGEVIALVGDNGMLQKTTDVIGTYVFKTLRQTGNPSQSMAVSLFQSVLGFVTVCGANWTARRFFSEGALF